MTTERLRSADRRAERGTRILDVTADLLLRHGARRVTIDDVAAGAGIGKGTVYLHWKTREQLFGAAFQREVLAALGELRNELRKDPQVSRLHRFARAYFLAITDRPLLRGFLLADADLLGKLAGSSDAALDERHGKLSHRYFELLAEHGLVRDDLALDELGYAYQATFEGFLRAEGLAGHSLQQQADLLARTIERAFESGQTPAETELRELADAVAELLTDLIDADSAEAGIPSPPA
ncbi:TetR/AcrR family transcriptional regulator [Kribbella sp. NPDC049227]|jgi:AcrR family transcriptional regulator|uniref:TetR/AcrR family transcriptional regulator n=1 Tax=Kribbella sp. NPDC049227 TaxID=3364113 RepID=UPI003723A11E